MGFSRTARSSGTIIVWWTTEGMTRARRQSSEELQILPLTCGFGDPGRTRTCTLRIRSRPTAVHAVSPGVVHAGQVGCAVQLIQPRHAV
jgi:hypothetical protein